jgi:hypothetical protein
MTNPLLFLAMLGCCVALASPAQAQDIAPQVWVNAGLLSYHLNRNNDYRERNWGLGAEAIVAPVLAVEIGAQL